MNMRRFALIAVPYFWLLALFLVPFLIVFKISLSDTALAIPPYTPTIKDGIGALIEQLDAEGWLLAVATGKSDRGLHACLDTHGIKHRFVSLQTADRHPSKPHPAMLEEALADAGVEPGDAVMIGDTTFDMEMAVNAGVRAIGVSWGYHEPQELFDTGASAVADTAEQLGDMIRGPA